MPGKYNKNRNSYGGSTESSEYNKGYMDGLRESFEQSELDAYYTGVGYGKRAANDKHIGFISAQERAEFERGMRSKDNHFNAHRLRAPTFLERMFGVKSKSSVEGRFKSERRKQKTKYKNTKKRVKNSFKRKRK